MILQSHIVRNCIFWLVVCRSWKSSYLKTCVFSFTGCSLIFSTTSTVCAECKHNKYCSVLQRRDWTYGSVQHQKMSGWQGGLPVGSLSWCSGAFHTESLCSPPETNTQIQSHIQITDTCCWLRIYIWKESWVVLCTSLPFVQTYCIFNWTDVA